LVRIVRTPQGAIEIDEKGKAAGRGAYLCRRRACWERAIPQKRLHHALRTQLSSEDERRLMDYGQQFTDLTESDQEEGEGDSLGG
jgi:predicted RNA-binding protein YlxR (DUF448 family)